MTFAGRLSRRLRREIRTRNQFQRTVNGQLTGARGLIIRGTQFPVQITVRVGGRLHLGDGVFLNQGVNILAAQSIIIGDNTRLADLAAVRDTDSHPVGPDDEVRTAPVVIGRNVWIGRGAVVMPGVMVGDHAVVAAGAVVIHDVPPATVVAGVPARVMRTFMAPPGWVRP
jgi:acetyltransferase-like isoleucine patch superfamily enzyme